MPTRTAILGRGICFAGSPTILATVPAGETWIVKSVEVSPSGFGSSTVQVYLEDAGLGLRALFIQQTIASLGVAHYSGWVVAEPGTDLVCNPTSVDQYVWISGAKLQGIAPP